MQSAQALYWDLICSPPCETIDTKCRDVSGPGRYGQTRTRRAGTLKNLDSDDSKAIRAESCTMERAAGLSSEVVAKGGRAVYLLKVQAADVDEIPVANAFANLRRATSGLLRVQEFALQSSIPLTARTCPRRFRLHG